MPDLAQVIQSGTANPWLYLPIALVLGALHALEPGHAKSLTAGFIIAVRGTVAQAVLLGLAATLGHTLIVWTLALIGLSLGDALITAHAEPYLVLASGLMVILLGARLLWMHRSGRLASIMRGLPHGHDHHHHRDQRSDRGHSHMTEAEMRKTYAGRRVSAGEIAWFGFSSGLLPCPAAIAVLLVCLNVKAFAIGIAMVSAFSIGLAVTLVGIGVIAAWGSHVAHRRGWGGRLSGLPLPLISGALVTAIGLFIAAQGLVLLGFLPGSGAQ